MVIRLFCNEDIGEFLSLAADEGWISDAWEVDFLRRNFPAGCLVCRNKGIPVAFLTSIKYEKSGWIGNLIVRKEWRGRGLGSALLDRALVVLDEAGWGDRRETLIRAIIARGSASLHTGGFMVRRRYGNAVQIGPWCSQSPEPAATLMERAMIPADPGSLVILDAPERNQHASKLLNGARFATQSSSTLMYRGEKPDYAPERIYALASMGSMG